MSTKRRNQRKAAFTVEALDDRAVPAIFTFPGVNPFANAALFATNPAQQFNNQANSLLRTLNFQQTFLNNFALARGNALVGQLANGLTGLGNQFVNTVNQTGFAPNLTQNLAALQQSLAFPTMFSQGVLNNTANLFNQSFNAALGRLNGQFGALGGAFGAGLSDLNFVFNTAQTGFNNALSDFNNAAFNAGFTQAFSNFNNVFTNAFNQFDPNVGSLPFQNAFNQSLFNLNDQFNAGLGGFNFGFNTGRNTLATNFGLALDNFNAIVNQQGPATPIFGTTF